MDHQIINISIDEIFPVAECYFLKTAGLDRKQEKNAHVWERALSVYEEIRENAELKAVLRYLTPEKGEGKDLYFQGVKVSCNAFFRLSFENVRGAFFYLLTAGNIETASDRIADQLYADIWGTSLIDAAQCKIRECLGSVVASKKEGDILSASFGPGYYGMELSQTEELFRIIDASLVNVVLSSGGMLVPQKSVTGLYLCVMNKDELPPSSCESCIGGVSGCAFCNRFAVQKPL